MSATSKKFLSIGLLVIATSCQLSASAQAPGSEQDAFSLYSAHRYAAAADSFERLIRTKPSPRLCYYAALSNRASSREMRAMQLFQYVVTNYPHTTEAAYAQQGLSQGQHLASASSHGNSQELPESVKNAMPAEMQKLLDSPMGKRAMEQVMRDKPDQIATIQEAEQKGLMNREKVAMATRQVGLPFSADASRAPNANADHPFTAADIAKLGAAGIDQSQHPNCWFEASMSSLAALPRGQALIASMIRCKDSDTYLVRFPNDGVEYTVSKRALNGTGDNALWASIIESAELQNFPDNQGAEGSEGDQSRLEVGLGCISGRRAEVINPGSCPAQELSSFIGSAIKSQNPIVAGTYGDYQLAGMPEIVFPAHAYTVIGFDPSKNMIVLRNPHGHQSHHFELATDPQHLEFEQLDNGVCKMSIGKFQKYFHSVARSFI